VSLFYIGITVCDPLIRVIKDQKTFGSRISNWNRTIPTAWEVYYNLQGLNYSAIQIGYSNSIDERKLFGYLEDLLIKCFGYASLNSANGGFYCNWHPSDDDITTMQNFYKPFVTLKL
jgi:hypothetical protein